MRSLALVTMAALLVGGSARADSLMTFTLELGGNNYSADYEASAPLPFESGSVGDDAEYDPDAVITWAVRVALSGIHEDPGGPGDGLAPLGICNVVCDLTLYKDSVAEGNEVCIGAGPMRCTSGNIGEPTAKGCAPTGAGFFSTINDGDSDGGVHADGYALGSFARTLDGNGDSTIGGRLIDTVANDGPNFDFGFYPSANGHSGSSIAEFNVPPITWADVPLGSLVGFEAGMQDFDFGVTYLMGVGQDTETFYSAGSGDTCEYYGLGSANALMEGQIDTRDFDAGTYILVVTPGTGNSILHGDISCPFGTVPGSFNTSSFATPVNQTQGDQISFRLLMGCWEPSWIIKWESVKTHTAPPGTPPGVCGNPPVELGIELNPSATADPNVTVETRGGGGIGKIVVTFDGAPPRAPTGTVYAQCEGGGAWPATTQTVVGNTLVLTWSPVLRNKKCYTIDLASNSPPYLQGDTDCRVKALTGDVDRAGAGGGTITIGDAIKIATQYNAKNPCTQPQYRGGDIDLTGPSRLATRSSSTRSTMATRRFATELGV